MIAADGGEQRPFQQVFFGEDVLFDLVGIFADAFAGFDRQELALIVPLVERGVLVEAFVALQPDQLGAVHGGQRLGDFGLADAGFAFEQQRALEKFHQPQRGRDIAVGDVADGGELVGDVFAIEGHGTRNTIDSSSCPAKAGHPVIAASKEPSPTVATGSSGRAGR